MKEKTPIEDMRKGEIEEQSPLEREYRQAYIEVFSSDKGRFVLADMLKNMYFFDECDKPEQVALQNFAKSLLKRMNLGISRGDTIKNMVTVLVSPAHANMKRG